MAAEVTLAFLNYNTSDELLQALRSVPAAVEGVEVRIIVIDNGSTDDSLDRIRAAAPEAELISLPRNSGFSAAFNRVFSYAISPWYLLLNTDIILPPGSVGQMLKLAGQHPEAGIAGMALVREDGTAQTSYYPFPTLASELINRSLWRRLHAIPESATGVIEVESIIGAAMLVPRTTVETVGMLDERYFFYLEETDWCCRIHQAGKQVLHFPGIRLTHLQGRAANKAPIKARIEFHRSRLIYFQTHYGTVGRIILLAGSFVRVLINALAYSVLTALTLGLQRKTRLKCQLYLGVAAWYCSGCPEGWGLR